MLKTCLDYRRRFPEEVQKTEHPTMTTSTITARKKGDPQRMLRERLKERVTRKMDVRGILVFIESYLPGAQLNTFPIVCAYSKNAERFYLSALDAKMVWQVVQLCVVCLGGWGGRGCTGG